MNSIIGTNNDEYDIIDIDFIENVKLTDKITKIINVKSWDQLKKLNISKNLKPFHNLKSITFNSNVFDLIIPFLNEPLANTNIKEIICKINESEKIIYEFIGIITHDSYIKDMVLIEKWKSTHSSGENKEIKVIRSLTDNIEILNTSTIGASCLTPRFSSIAISNNDIASNSILDLLISGNNNSSSPRHNFRTIVIGAANDQNDHNTGVLVWTTGGNNNNNNTERQTLGVAISNLLDMESANSRIFVELSQPNDSEKEKKKNKYENKKFNSKYNRNFFPPKNMKMPRK